MNIRAHFKSHSLIISGQRVRLSNKEFKFFLVLWMRGRVQDYELMDLFYSNREDGGPEYNPFGVIANNINKSLRPHNIALVSLQNGLWEIVALPKGIGNLREAKRKLIKERFVVQQGV